MNARCLKDEEIKFKTMNSFQKETMI